MPGLFLLPIMRYLFVFLLLVSVAGCSLLGIHPKIHNPKRAGKFPEKTATRALLAESTPARDCYDVVHYDLSVDFGTDLLKQQAISGKVIMTFVMLQPSDSLQFDLHETMVLTDVAYREAPSGKITQLLQELPTERVPFTRRFGAVFVKFPQVLQAGERLQLLISYSGTPPEAKRPPWRGGFVHKKDENGNPWIGVACQSEGASLWWPCKDIMTDEPAAMDIRLTVPQGLTAVSNGRFTDTLVVPATATSPQRTTWWWKLNCPINVYNVTFYIGKFRLLKDYFNSKETGKVLDIDHYVLEYNYDKAKTHFKQVKDHIRFYEKRFGPYPWYEDGFKLVESPFAGMEHQSAIAYGNGYKNGYGGLFDYIILHEAAHEWWGNSVSAADLADGWLHEGFATYAEALFVEEKLGREAYLNYLFYQRLTIINRRPVVGPKGLRYFNYKDGDIYVKGSWILHTLRSTIDNDSLFFDLLKSFCIQNARKQISSQDFVLHVTAKTGKDYGPFFRQYLDSRFVPELEYYTESGYFYCRWRAKTVNPDFDLPVRAEGLMEGTVFNPKIGQVSRIAINSAGFSINWSNYLIKPVENKHLKREFERK